MPHQQPVLPIFSSDGHRFELIHVPASPAHASLLFLPGMGMSARQYIDFGKALSPHGIEVFIHEWRGLGSSDLRAGRRINWGYLELLQQDLDAATTRVAKAATRPKILFGGHSLGSQLACLLAALRPEACAGLMIIAGGAPFWRTYTGWMRFTLPLVFAGMPAVAGLIGHYPGRRLGFAGREARGVIRDWAASGRTGIYAPRGLEHDLETALGQLRHPTLSLRMADDWFVPQASLDWLTAKLASAPHRQVMIDRHGLSGSANHYRWMREPETTAARIADWMRDEATAFHSEASNPAATSRA